MHIYIIADSLEGRSGLELLQRLDQLGQSAAHGLLNSKCHHQLYHTDLAYPWKLERARVEGVYARLDIDFQCVQHG